MKKNAFLYTFVCLLGAVIFSNIACAGVPVVGAGTAINSVPAKGAATSFLKPFIESILENPHVKKHEIAPNFIKATGHKNGTELHFVVHIKHRLLHGEWQSFYSNNQLCDSGRFANNLPDGEWKTWYPNGQLKSVRNYHSAKYRYIKNDIKRGHPRLSRYTITRYAQAKKDIRHFFMPLFHHNHTDVSSLTVLDKISYNTEGDGAAYIAPFANCLHHGQFINYAPDGSVTESGMYENGLKHGLWHETTKDGLAAAGLYHHGIKKSQWKYYDADNKLLYTERYRHGKLVSVHRF